MWSNWCEFVDQFLLEAKEQAVSTAKKGRSPTQELVSISENPFLRTGALSLFEFRLITCHRPGSPLATHLSVMSSVVQKLSRIVHAAGSLAHRGAAECASEAEARPVEQIFSLKLRRHPTMKAIEEVAFSSCSRL